MEWIPLGFRNAKKRMMSNRKIRRIVSLLFFAPYLRQVLSINVHWLVADATGDYAVIEYWKNELYIFRPKDRLDIVPFTSQVVPYEYNSIENYYVNVDATKTYMTDNWQIEYSSKVRVGNLMGAYASKVHLKFIIDRE